MIDDCILTDHSKIADAFCDYSLKGLDASYRRMDTAAERAELAERLYSFITGHGEEPVVLVAE